MSETPLDMELADRLAAWAQNEEMIDTDYTAHGRDCLAAAERLRQGTPMPSGDTIATPCCHACGGPIAIGEPVAVYHETCVRVPPLAKLDQRPHDDLAARWGLRGDE